MSSMAQDLDETLRRIDPQAARRVERLVRGILVLPESSGTENSGSLSLLDLSRVVVLAIYSSAF